jgi:hypothetical protein
VRDHIPDEIARLKQQPGKHLLMIGSTARAQTFMQLGLIDEYRLNINPVALGIRRADVELSTAWMGTDSNLLVARRLEISLFIACELLGQGEANLNVLVTVNQTQRFNLRIGLREAESGARCNVSMTYCSWYPKALARVPLSSPSAARSFASPTCCSIILLGR